MVFYFSFVWVDIFVCENVAHKIGANTKKSIRKAPLKSPGLKRDLAGLCGILLR